MGYIKNWKRKFNKNNFDYGVELLKDLIQAVPGFWEARELLRDTERRKTQNLAGFQTMMGSREIGILPQSRITGSSQNDWQNQHT